MNVAKRWQPLFSLLVMLVLVLLAVQPAGARPQAAPRNAGPQQIAGTHGTSLRTGRTAAPLRDLAARVNASGPIRDGRTINGTPYQGFDANGQAYTYYDLRQNLRIPRGKSSSSLNRAPTTTAGAQVQAARPDTPPLKKIYDDPMPDLDAFWEGLNQGSNRTNFTFGFLPPDTNGDTSGNVFDTGFYVQTVNGNFSIWDYSQFNVYGAWPKTVIPPTPINALFTGFGGACEFTNDGDPVVLYDEWADRWLISQFALPVFDFETNPFDFPFYQCIAISQTADPTGDWYLYEFGGLFEDMNDYPKIGIWQDGYYMTVNQFNQESFAWEGQGVMVFERDAMLLGDPAQWVYFDPYASCTGSEPECFLGGMLPADNDGTPAPNGTPGYVVQFDDDAWGYSGDQLQIWSVTVDWANPANSALAPDVSLPVDPFDSEVCPGYDRDCIPQPDTDVGLDAISDRLMYRLQYRNFGDHQTLVTNHTVKEAAGQAGVRWYELRNTGTGWSVYQQGDFAPDTSNRWMGSLAMDAVGNMALGYSVSDGVGVYPSVRYAGRLASDPLNTLPRTEMAVVNGAGSQTSTTHRWGDYSSMSIAPDGCSFIFTNEYLRGTTPAEWYTRMGNFHFQACTLNDITPPDTTITSHPPDPSTGTVTFEFTGVDSGGSGVDHFVCSLDGSVFNTCTSPKTYTGLTSGTHTFQVAAVDAAGNVDPTPASFTWQVVNTVVTFKSLGAQDGWVLELNEWSGLGGTMDAGATTFRVGDEAGDKQYRSVLSFDTSTLPDNAVIAKVTLKIRKQGLVGTDPFTILNKLAVDIRKGPFSTSALLQLEDFNAAANLSPAGFVPNAPVSGLYSSSLARAAFPYLNLLGKTQLRLRFQKDDNDDLGADYMLFFSGNAVFLSQRPSLIVEYYTP